MEPAQEPAARVPSAAIRGGISEPRRSQLLLFFGLSLLSWLIWIPQAAAARGYDLPAVSSSSPLNVLAVWAPGLGAIIVCAFAAGRAGIRDLVRPIRCWRAGIGWYAFIILFPVAQWAVALGIDRLLGQTYKLGPSLASEALGPQAGAMLPVLVIFALPNALGEELGWRGFALPKLQARHSALAASIVIGLFWSLWHIPTWVAQKPTGISTLAGLLTAISTVPAAILFTRVYNNTNGSLLLVWLFHASIAITGYLTPALRTHTQILLCWAVAIAIIVATGPACFSRRAARAQLRT